MRQMTSFTAFAAAMVLLLLSTTLAPAATFSGAQAAITGPDVLHVQARHVWLAPDGTRKHERDAEFWLDPTTGDARLTEKDLAGTYEVTFVRSGRTYTRYFPLQRRAVTQIAADDSAPYLSAVHDMVLGYKAALAQGRLQVLGEESVGGQPAIKVRRQLLLEGQPHVIEASLDRPMGLPLKEVVYRQTGGALQEVESHLITYNRVARVARDQLPAEMFSTAPPPGWTSATSRALTPATARAFREFDLYWLGQSHGGLPLFGISHDETRGAAGQLSSVAVVYAHPFVDGRLAPGQISLVQRAPLTPEEVASRERLGTAGPGEPVQVGGRQATLYTVGSDATQLELTIGRTFITLHGATRAQVIQAAERLQRLN